MYNIYIYIYIYITFYEDYSSYVFYTYQCICKFPISFDHVLSLRKFIEISIILLLDRKFDFRNG